MWHNPNKEKLLTTNLTTIDSVVEALYQAVSFAKDVEPNYQLLQLLFHPRGHVVQPVEDTSGTLNPMCVSDFIKSLRTTLRAEGILALGGREEEIERRTLTFRRVAHVFSSYHFTLIGSETPLARGVNTLQLVYDSERWWILSLAWDRAKPGESLTLSEMSKNGIPKQKIP